MMHRATISPEQRQLEIVAREYETKGYRVIVEPTMAELPDFLRGYQPDMIAYGDYETVIIEVKSGAKLAESYEMVPLADVINAKSGWRFELIVTKPSTDEEAKGLSPWEIRQRIADARELPNDQDDAAAILAWSAAEATMRLLAKQHGVTIGKTQRETPLVMTKKLFSLGLLDRQDYEVFEEGVRIRNLIVHGYLAPETRRETVRDLIRSIEHVLIEVADQP